MKSSIKGFFSKYDRIHGKLWIWSDVLMKFLMENFTVCAVYRLTEKIWAENIFADKGITC